MKILSFKSAFIIGVFTLISVVSIRAQILPIVPCLQDYQGRPYKGLTFQIPHLQQFPPLSTGMPFDVLIGYIGYDSLARYGNRQDLIAYFDRQSYNDTLKHAMKYIYTISDFDPIRFALYKTGGIVNTGIYQMDRSEPQGYLYERIKYISPQPRIDNLLMWSSVIAHISVIDTFVVYDSTARWANHNAVVTSTIIDTIKGKVIPSCHNFYPLQSQQKEDNLLSSQQALPGSCLQFQYSLEWFNLDARASEGGLNVMENKPLQSHVKKGNEYLVFLTFVPICHDSIAKYLTLSPRNFGSPVWNIYPITNGIVEDPGNDFGFGSGLTVAQFKAALRTKINYLLNP